MVLILDGSPEHNAHERRNRIIKFDTAIDDNRTKKNIDIPSLNMRIVIELPSLIGTMVCWLGIPEGGSDLY